VRQHEVVDEACAERQQEQVGHAGSVWPVAMSR
jgi:hypothetical protein